MPFIKHSYLPKQLKIAVIFVLAILGNSPHAFANAAQAPVIFDVYKDPNCGCCEKWLTYINQRGFITRSHNVENLFSLKQEKGIPTAYQSCHTAISSEGYVFEGHIPAKYIQEFLAKRPPNAVGLSVPAMPVGSPGMEYQDKFRPYQVLLLKVDGTTEVFAQVNSLEESLR